LAVHDPVAISLKGGAQRAVILGALAPRRVRASRQRRLPALLLLADALGEARRHHVLLARDAHRPILVSRAPRALTPCDDSPSPAPVLPFRAPRMRSEGPRPFAPRYRPAVTSSDRWPASAACAHDARASPRSPARPAPECDRAPQEPRRGCARAPAS